MDKTIDIERLLKDVPEEALPWAYAYIAFLCAKPEPKWTDSDAAVSSKAKNFFILLSFVIVGTNILHVLYTAKSSLIRIEFLIHSLRIHHPFSSNSS
jgi:hypothetical protein